MTQKVVIFDLDDTLYKEIEYVESAYQDIANWLESIHNIHDVYGYMISCFYNKENVFERVNKNYLLNIDIDQYLEKYRNHYPNLVLEANTITMLNELLKNNCYLGIITDGRELTQRNKINALALHNYILEKECVISESFGYSKPSLENYLYFSEKLGNKQYYYVGDNTSKDFIAPNYLGWKSVCLLDDGRNIHKQSFFECKEKLPQYIISDILELLDIILK
ncbi:putative hydrolase of the HAD superfamily [Parabacteroides sp. PH5-13]|uniref:HAD family hydrolase n=1 Tax=unclassified Parabacteroides TaxID=2649774 RepID=UPI002473E343|nr:MULTISPECIES: HAD family hydrolase [unclassified Parabacteroides]MDH6305593.1 putative hydrolase of the HAD superfamily [Parabacteroides sp. PH5-39]MDH6319852.1 putative hydrolase of the HAD superfamily [Parabacteroides sp. PH5-13]MDH6323557.1 putative hydrolase of the HAD superfamily [Parabacteroides sp. PH5-8]MDH6384669.1 putative hydrolase of the HAD superfamily [Parabacteroides sp. PH5-17]MDH6394024.1 putative hydrolase of the HAD superfamily [Parabacteroides sp. PFB2-22]